ncbi:MAG: ribose 5-phosphate isomerase B [Oscillospiraceae bacterium]|jgi:ribose 5-phosphate isomerase B
MKIALASDHGGFQLKQAVMKHLDEKGYEYVDYGCYTEESCDYPDMAARACRAIQRGECDRGIIFCGTGLGISMAANKFRGIRCAAVSDYYGAKYCRLHNDANILSLGGRILGEGEAEELVDVFLTTEFEGGERHSRRIEKIAEIERGELPET